MIHKAFSLSTIVVPWGVGIGVLLGATVQSPAQVCSGTTQIQVSCEATAATEHDARKKVQGCIVDQVLNARIHTCNGACAKVGYVCKPGFPQISLAMIACSANPTNPQEPYLCRYIGPITVNCVCGPDQCGKIITLPLGATFSHKQCGAPGSGERLANAARLAVLKLVHDYMQKICAEQQCAPLAQGPCRAGVSVVNDASYWEYVVRRILPMPAVSPPIQQGNQECVTATLVLNSFRCRCSP